MRITSVPTAYTCYYTGVYIVYMVLVLVTVFRIHLELLIILETGGQQFCIHRSFLIYTRAIISGRSSCRHSNASFTFYDPVNI